MNFSALSPLAFALGLAGLALGLFLAQRLRVRHRRVTVVTTVFWKAAVEETRARVFVRRFRHPWAYALLLAIAGLLWLAVAAPESSGRGRALHVLVIDGSARMARGVVTSAGSAASGSAFEAALEAARERAAELPRARRSVLLAGAHLETLLAPGEELPLFDARARRLKPAACPATLEAAVARLADGPRPEEGLQLECFSIAEPDAALLAACAGPGFEVATRLLACDARENAGVVALGASPAQSGAWDTVDVLVATRSRAAPEITLDGAPLESSEARAVAGGFELVLRDLPARGGRLEARLAGGDALGLDDAAALTLPARPKLRVALSPNVPPALRAVIERDPGVVAAEGLADVVVRYAGESFGANTPALELVDEESGAPAFALRTPAEAADAAGDERANVALARWHDELGLGEIDATALAGTAGRPIELALQPADERGVALWASLCGERYDLARSRAFPLFIARALRWLANVPAFEGTLAAGEPRLAPEPRWTDAQGRTLDAAGGEARLPRAGAYTDEARREHAAALLDASTTGPVAAPPPARAPERLARFDPLPWIVLAALVLLLVEWRLVRRERIP